MRIKCRVIAVVEMHTPEMSGSGQRGICIKCGKPPSPEGHDGCLGILRDRDIMNACCGHGDEKLAYIQYWSKPRISGKAAIDEQEKLITTQKANLSNAPR